MLSPAGCERWKASDRMVCFWVAEFPMQMRTANEVLLVPAVRRWSRSRARSICPRKHLRMLPIRTRPSLFGGD